MIVLLPVAVFIIGFLLWTFSGNAQVKEMGKIMFWTGMLVALFRADPAWFHVFGKN